MPPTQDRSSIRSGLSVLRGDGTAWLLIGSLVAGLLAYVFQVAGGRALGSAAFAPIANLWTLQYVIMAILLFAIEQYEVRAVAAAGGDARALHGAWPVLWTIVIAVALGATALLFVFADKLLGGAADLALVGGTWVITAGAFGMVRGIYGGRAEYRMSGIATAADWVARILLTLIVRSEEHTSELQSLAYLVCRLLLEKKKKKPNKPAILFNSSLSANTNCPPATRSPFFNSPAPATSTLVILNSVTRLQVILPFAPLVK